MRMTLHGTALRSLPAMTIEGEALVTTMPITFLGFVDATTGRIVEKGHELDGQSIRGKIFVFPRGIGSTVAPYVLINLARNNNAPLAIINRESDQATVAGASMTRIPLVYRLDQDPTQVIKTGNKVRIRIEQGKGIVEILS